ncbi:MAG: PEPxxWA-CTERM sorting domain-containing protein [Gammaproteobacteria bacterium]
MKTFALALIAAAAAVCQPASAKIRTYDYTVTDLTISYEGNHYATLDGAFGGVLAAAGDSLHGSFSFDDAQTPWLDGPYAASLDDYFHGSMSITFERGGVTETNNADFVAKHSSSDLTRTFTATVFAGPLLYHIGLSGPQAGYGDAGFIDGAHSTSKSFWANYWGFDLNGKLTSVVEVTPVPEPSTYAMMLGGLAVVGALARRRQQK